MSTNDKSFIDIVNEALEAEDTKLLVIDKVALKIQKEISQKDPDRSVIENLIVQDQALSAQVLKVANSSFFRGLVKVATIHDAIIRLGIQEVANIVWLVTEKKKYRAADTNIQRMMNELWKHSVGCAIGAQWLARQCDFHSLANELFFAGLLHDIGKLFVLTIIDDILRSRDNSIQFTEELIKELMASQHTNLGYALMQNWNLPEKYGEVVRDHHEEQVDSAQNLIIMVRIVDYACRKLGIGLQHDPSITLPTLPEAGYMGLSEIDLAKLEIKLEDSLLAAG